MIIRNRLNENMLTPQLQIKLEEKWNNCWPVSNLRPLALLDLISYMFFIKKLDDCDLIHEKTRNAASDTFIYSKETEEFTWSKLQNLDAREIQHLFNKEHGIIDLMYSYAHLNALYSDFFKAPLLIVPTPKLISNSIEIVNLIETSDPISQQAIVEYLFNKSTTTAENRQELLPEYVSKLMVSIAEPLSSDIILDPSAGTGSLLINTYSYISNKNVASQTPSKKFIEGSISGIESNLIFLRLAAMNMFLHGIKNPKIRFAPFVNETLKENPTLIISNLLFSTGDKQSIENTPEVTKLQKENLILQEILSNLDDRGRAVILVPQILLKSDNPAVIKTRKKIVDQCNLEAVITLEAKTDSLFSGAAILVFDKKKSSTENIWFCKWGSRKKKTRNEQLGNNNSETEDFNLNEEIHILDKWQVRKRKQKDLSRNSFFISDEYIKTNSYNLSFNDYKLIRQDQPANQQDENMNGEETPVILPAKRENLHEFFDASTPLPSERKKRRLAPVLIVLLLLTLGSAAYYWLYLKDNYFHIYTGDKIADSSNNFKINNVSTTSGEDTTTAFHNNGESPEKQQYVSRQTTQEEPPSPKQGVTKYTVINKTYFHYQPDSTKKKGVYLEPRKDIVLTPRDEKNGFVYVVYINSRGEATHGWLNKKDLEAVE